MLLPGEENRRNEEMEKSRNGQEFGFDSKSGSTLLASSEPKRRLEDSVAAVKTLRDSQRH
jgi:hypothetical protein